jgi:outer membrane protein
MIRQTVWLGICAAFVVTWLTASSACAQSITLTREQILQQVETLIAEGRVTEAQPYLAAMEKDPALKAEAMLLRGLVAKDAQDWKAAAKNFRTVLSQKPKWTRARLELARALYNQGEQQAADYHFRLAEADKLPPDIARVVQGYRQSIRASKNWRFNLAFGVAPDTNINSSTTVSSVALQADIFGDNRLLVPEESRKKTGVGQTVNTSGSARLRLSETYALDVEAAARMVNYTGKNYDDISLMPAVGISRDFGSRTRIGLAALYSQRWYGGADAQRSIGARLRLQQVVGSSGQLQADISARKTTNFLSADYSGAQYAISLAYDRALSKTTSASLSVFGLREPLANSFYANTSTGAALSLGSELPWGINGGLSVSAGRTWYDSGTEAFAARRDWTLQGYAYLGLRSIRYLGFSPSIEYRLTRNASNLELYDFTRHRFEFALASYF